MWRDPLDELIDELEQVAPPAPATASIGDQAVRQQLLHYTDIVLRGSAQARRRLETDPKFRALLQAMKPRGQPSDG